MCRDALKEEAQVVPFEHWLAANLLSCLGDPGGTPAGPQETAQKPGAAAGPKPLPALKPSHALAVAHGWISSKRRRLVPGGTGGELYRRSPGTGWSRSPGNQGQGPGVTAELWRAILQFGRCVLCTGEGPPGDPDLAVSTAHLLGSLCEVAESQAQLDAVLELAEEAFILASTCVPRGPM